MTMKPTIMIMQPHLEVAAPRLDADYTVLRAWLSPPPEQTAEVRAVVVAGELPLDKAVLMGLPKLGLIACFAAGYDSVDTVWAKAHGLSVTHAPGVNAEDVADRAVGLIIASRRRILVGDHQVRTGGWIPDVKLITPSLAGQRVGIVGLGAIGHAVAVRCLALRMQVSWWGPRPKLDASWPRAESLLALAKDNDVLVIACPANETNRGLISADIIAAVGPQGLLVNVARGQLVDEDALIAALKAGALGAAALDVFETEPTPSKRWADVPRTVLTPHTAGATQAAVFGMMQMLTDNLAAFFAGRPLINPVA